VVNDYWAMGDGIENDGTVTPLMAATLTADVNAWIASLALDGPDVTTWIPTFY
jgi:hypothetical protein